MNSELIEVSSSKKIELIDVTPSVLKTIKKHELTEGILYLFVPHTTAAVTINESHDQSVGKDLEKALETLVPNINYSHMEGNSPAHILSTLVGCHTIIPVKNSKAELGTWQGIYFCEFDGPRKRKLKLYWN